MRTYIFYTKEVDDLDSVEAALERAGASQLISDLEPIEEKFKDYGRGWVIRDTLTFLTRKQLREFRCSKPGMDGYAIAPCY